MGWKGKRVLVTGAAGFIGSHLVERLLTEGAHVRAFVRYNSAGSWGWLDDLEPANRNRLEVRPGDIRDARFVEDACRDVEVVFHLAALIAIPYSYQAAESFTDTNVRGTQNLLEAVRRSGGTRMVHTSTSEVYGSPDSLPIRETHPLKAQSPYSASKIAADKLCEAYACSFETPVVIVRPFNTYGPRQSARAVLPTILSQLLRGEKEVRLGSVDPRRDLTFVADTADGLLRAGDAAGLIPGDAVQLGTGSALSVRELFETACRVLGREARIVHDAGRVRPSRSEVIALVSDPQRARQQLGWEARTSLAEGLQKTAAWLESHLDHFRAGYQV